MLERLYELTLKKKEPDLYKELLDVYPKEVSRKAYVKVKIK